ncbi:MAG: hypothetical protein AAF824_06710 [Bacteroidota bacterium]
MAKKEQLQAYSLAELQNKQKNHKTMVYLLVGLAIPFTIILGIKWFSDEWSNGEDFPILIILFCLIGSIPFTLKEKREIEEELQSRNA